MTKIAIAVFALCFMTFGALAQQTRHTFDLFDPAPREGDSVTSLVVDAVNAFACSNFYDPLEEFAYSDDDAFDCQLKASLEGGLSEVYIHTAGTEAAYPNTRQEFEALTAVLPERLERWTEAVENSGGQVAVCIVNRPNAWSYLVRIAVRLVRALFFDESRREANLYASASNYNAALVFNAEEVRRGNDGWQGPMRLDAIRLIERSSGPIVADTCSWAG